MPNTCDNINLYIQKRNYNMNAHEITIQVKFKKFKSNILILIYTNKNFKFIKKYAPKIHVTALNHKSIQH